MTVRAAGVADAETLARLNRFVHDTHLARRPEYFAPVDVQAASGWFREQLGRPGTASWIAEEGDAAVGYVVMFLHERAASPFRRTRRWCEIVTPTPTPCCGGSASSHA